MLELLLGFILKRKKVKKNKRYILFEYRYRKEKYDKAIKDSQDILEKVLIEEERIKYKKAKKEKKKKVKKSYNEFEMKNYDSETWKSIGKAKQESKRHKKKIAQRRDRQRRRR